MMGLKNPIHKGFVAIAAGIFVAVIAESFVASALGPVLAPLKLSVG